MRRLLRRDRFEPARKRHIVFGMHCRDQQILLAVYVPWCTALCSPGRLQRLRRPDRTNTMCAGSLPVFDDSIQMYLGRMKVQTYLKGPVRQPSQSARRLSRLNLRSSSSRTRKSRHFFLPRTVVAKSILLRCRCFWKRQDDLCPPPQYLFAYSVVCLTKQWSGV